MMQRLVAYATTRRRIPKVFFSNKFFLRQSSWFSHVDDSTENEFEKVISILSNAAPHGPRYQINSDLNALDMKFIYPEIDFTLEVIETYWETKFVQTPKISPHNLIYFIKWCWKTDMSRRFLITTPVLESLVSSICSSTVPTHHRPSKKDIYFLWDLLKTIAAEYQTTGPLFNARILNKLIQFFSLMEQEGKAALKLFHEFEGVFQCVPNRDTYGFTMKALYATTCSDDMLQQAAAVCQKMLLYPETLLPDDGEVLRDMISWFSSYGMIKEAHALYLAAFQKWKRNSNWPLEFNMLLPLSMIIQLCLEKETAHLALEMLTDMAEEADDWAENAKEIRCEYIFPALCRRKDLDAAKKLIFKMIADGPLPDPKFLFRTIITAYDEAGEVGQALEMVILMESKGLCTCCDSLIPLYTYPIDYLQIIRAILEEATKKDANKLIIALLYHTLIFGYCTLHFSDVSDFDDFGETLKLLTQMKDFGVTCTNHDECHKLFHSLHLKDMDRKLSREQLEEMEPIGRAMAEKQLDKMRNMDEEIIMELLEEMHLNIRASFS